MRVLGVDPGSRKTGWGVVDETRGELRQLASGVAASQARDVVERLAVISREIDEVLDRWKPDVVALERAFVGRNVASALRLGEVRGVVLAAAGRRGLQVVDYPPATVKVAVAGSGAAAKNRVAMGVSGLLRVDTEPGDAADALAVAICHVRHDRFSSRLRSATILPTASRRRVRVSR